MSVAISVAGEVNDPHIRAVPLDEADDVIAMMNPLVERAYLVCAEKGQIEIPAAPCGSQGPAESRFEDQDLIESSAETSCGQRSPPATVHANPYRGAPVRSPGSRSGKLISAIGPSDASSSLEAFHS